MVFFSAKQSGILILVFHLASSPHFLARLDLPNDDHDLLAQDSAVVVRHGQIQAALEHFFSSGHSGSATLLRRSDLLCETTPRLPTR